MFSLIITIVSIALVVALVAATMYHGGDTLTQGRTSADASAFVTGAQQISAAKLMSDSMGGSATATVAELVTNNYLSSQPSVKGGAWSLEGPSGAIGRHVQVLQPIDPAVCAQINKNAGSASDELVGADLAAAKDQAAALPYACVTVGAAGDQDTAANNNFIFKY